jgi:hypothetical protein
LLVSDRSWGYSRPGRRPGFAISDVELLDKAETYERTTIRPTRAGFVAFAGFTTKQTAAGETVSQPQFRTWCKRYGMDYPLVPNFDDQERPILVFLVEADAQARLTWISRNVSDVLAFDADEIRGRPSAEVLYGGRDPRHGNPELVAVFMALKAGHVIDATPPPTCLIARDGHEVPVQLHAGYGTQNRSFYIQATVLEPVTLAPSLDEELARVVRKDILQEYLATGMPPYRFPGAESDAYNTAPYVIQHGQRKPVVLNGTLGEIEQRLRRATRRER